MRATPSAGNGGKPSCAIQRRSTRARRAAGSRSNASTSSTCGSSRRASASAQRVLVVEQVDRFAAQRRAARERGIDVRPAFAQQRQHLVAQEVAVERDVGIARILDPAQAVLAVRRPAAARAAASSNGRHSQPRPKRRHGRIAASPSGPDARKARSRNVSAWSSRWWARASTSPSRSAVVERGMAGLARGRLPARGRASPSTCDANHRQRNAERVAGRARNARPSASASAMQAVVDVDRAQARSRSGGDAAQACSSTRRIQPATEPDQDRPARRGATTTSDSAITAARRLTPPRTRRSRAGARSGAAAARRSATARARRVR